MAKESRQRSAVLQGTLDMMILKTLLYGPAHGHRIGKHIQRLRMSFCRCSMARFILRSIAWRKEGGWSPNGRRRRTATGSSSATDDG
jgi:hypothetical protein